MPGIFGTKAPFLADLNLILQVIIGGLLLFGYLSIKRGVVPRHRLLMISAVALNLLAILFLMIPASRVAQPYLYGTLADLISISVPLHMLGGAVLMLLAVYLIASMFNYPRPNRLRTSRFETLMRILIVLWFVTMVGGLVNYLLKYIL